MTPDRLLPRPGDPQDIEKHIHLVVAVVIFLSLLPAIIAWLRVEAARQARGAGSGRRADR